MIQIFLKALLVGFSGAVMPGALLTYVINQSLKKGIKVVFKPKKVKQTDAGQPEITATDFDNILTEIVTHQQDPYLQQAFELVVHSKQIDEDVMFL